MDRCEQEVTEKPILLIGGTGFFESDGGRNLHPDIEHIMPYYDLYKEYVNYKIQQGRSPTYFDDYLNYSIGFTSRGCFRKCHFCVNKKYDHAFAHSPVEEFLDPTRPRIYLWDDNIFALKDDWERIFDQLMQTNKPFQFRQGLDIRLLTEEHAKKLCKCKYHGDFIFAFDHVNQAELIEKKLQIWRRYCEKTTKLYVLCAFDSWDYKIVETDLNGSYHHYFLNRMNNLSSQEARDQEDIMGVFERIVILMKYGCLPYIMRFQNYKLSKYRGMYIQLARWCNQPQFFKKKSFRQFCEANREYSCSEKCAAYQAMIDFEKDRPDIAQKYFDTRFDQTNECISSYGRKNTRPCEICKQSDKFITWIQYTTSSDEKSFIHQYFSGDLDFNCLLLKKCPQCKVNPQEISKKVFKDILNITPDEILKIIDDFSEIHITSNTIPQFSRVETAIKGLNCLYAADEDGVIFSDFGKKLQLRRSKNNISDQKYGENHAKLLTLMDLAYIDKSQKPYKIRISPLGKTVYTQKEPERVQVTHKLILKIPLVQKILKEAKNRQSIESFISSMISESTVDRRLNALNTLLKELKILNSSEIGNRLSAWDIAQSKTECHTE